MKTHHKSSKRVKLSTKYNLQKKIREHRRRMRKEAKRMGLQKRVRKDPGIPNSWPYKAEMLAELERKKEKRDEDMAKRRQEAKNKSLTDHKQMEIDRREAQTVREEKRKEKHTSEALKWQLQAMRRTLPGADVVLQVLDSRDPLGCRCAAVEAWAQENKKRIIFVLAKADLVTPETAAKWLVVLGQIAPAVAVSAEAGREGVRELLVLLGQAPAAPGQPQIPAATAVGVVGYAGTGKKALVKAVRQEVKTTAPWLLDACRLRPVPGQASTAGSALHDAMCKPVPRGAANATSIIALLASGSGAGSCFGIDPVDVIKEFVTRASPQTLLRYFRLPAFEGVDGFLNAFCTDRKLKTKKGKKPQPAAIAQRILTELPALPGCFCMPPEVGTQGAQNFWSAWSAVEALAKNAMEAQARNVGARGVSGPAATALGVASSSSLGLAVDIVGALAENREVEDHIDGEDDVSDSDCSGSGDDDMDSDSGEEMSDDEGEEGEEEEGEESEEEMSDDDL